MNKIINKKNIVLLISLATITSSSSSLGMFRHFKKLFEAVSESESQPPVNLLPVNLLRPQRRQRARHQSPSDYLRDALSKKYGEVIHSFFLDGLLNDLENLPLHKACIYAGLEEVRMLVKTYELDVNSLAKLTWGRFNAIVINPGPRSVILGPCTSEIDNMTPLHAVCARDVLWNFPGEAKDLVEQEIPTIVEFLIANGAEVDARDGSLQTPLHWISTLKNPQVSIRVAELLIENGADINAQGNSGETPLHLAAFRHHEILTEYLIEKGATINILNDEGKTPLDLEQQALLEQMLNERIEFWRQLEMQTEKTKIELSDEKQIEVPTSLLVVL